MFNWFLKLLGIEEDRPVSSNNSFLKSASTKAVNETQLEPEQQPVPEQKSKDILDAAVKAPDISPVPVPVPASKSLGDQIPGLKANYVKVLNEAGYTTKASIDKASDKELLSLKGIGQATLKLLRA